MTRLQSVVMTFPARLGEAAISRFELVFSELLDSVATSCWQDDDGKWQIEALFTFAPSARLIEHLLAPLFEGEEIRAVPITIATLEKRDWLAENRAAFPPIQIGRFWIHGSHVARQCPAACLPLLIDAASAFGSGTHPTTEGCLRAIQLIHPIAPRRILDMGCGSAILAIAAARLWPTSHITAADNDPIALKVAAINRTLNKISSARMRLVSTEGLGSRTVCNNAPFGLVLANILAGPLKRMARNLTKNLKADGWLVLSGILSTQAANLEFAFRAQNMRVWHRICLGDWTTIIMRPAVAGTMPQLWGGHKRFGR
ncbi:50S ribosomal protein L11 methyltransferase [Candidatus Puniceispirillum sp.]|nr:50S ribosomal protein L11 methyltransferase [Candidatus Puniceispirillum sp.]